MHFPDYEIDWRLAKVVAEAARLLVAYLDECPAPSKSLTDRLDHYFDTLPSPRLLKGASPEAIEVAQHLANWIARVTVAIERPQDLEEDGF